MKTTQMHHAGMVMVGLMMSVWMGSAWAGKAGQMPVVVEKPFSRTPKHILRVDSAQPDLIVTIAGVVVTLKYIPSGEYLMGCLSREKDCIDDDEQRVHNVRIRQGFYMMSTEVTQGLYTAVMGENPSYFTACGLECPVEQVSWEEANAFSGEVSSLVGGIWGLPTEEQWEWAARGGEEYAYAGSDTLEDVGWYRDNSGATTHPVKQKKANAFGLYDMSGNVWEWMEGIYASYPGGLPVRSSFRGNRGGSLRDVYYMYVYKRFASAPGSRDRNLGFRLVRSIP